MMLNGLQVGGSMVVGRNVNYVRGMVDKTLVDHLDMDKRTTNMT